MDQTTTDGPEIIFTNGSKFPNKIKFRKRIRIFPVEFVFGCNWDRLSQMLQPVVSCKETILKGQVSLDLPRSRIQYKLKFPLVGFGHFNVAAGCNYQGVIGQYWSPTVAIGCSFNKGGATLSQGAIDMRQKIHPLKHFGVEVCGSAKVPLPAAQYSVNEADNNLQLGEGAFHFHLAELNALIDF